MTAAAGGEGQSRSYGAAVRATLDGVTVEQMLASRRIKWHLHPEDVLPAWVAEMDFPVAPEIEEDIRATLAADGYGYHPLPIDPRLREAFVARMQECFDWEVEPRSVFSMVNVVQGLDIGIELYSRPGDRVVIQTPIYAPFHRAVDGSSRRRAESPLVRGPERYEIDWDHLRSVIDADTRVFLLCNPHNPTGRVLDREELEGISEIVLSNDLVVVCDEIHAELAYDGERHIPFASLSPEIASRTLTITSATKAFNIAGLPMAVAVIGSKDMKKRWRRLSPHLLGHGGILGTQAAISAWTRCSAWLDEVKTYLAENRSFVAERVARDLPGVEMHVPEATYLAWLDCRGLDLPQEPGSFFLDRARVGLSDGNDFGAPGAGHVRLNFATSRPILAEILERMAGALRET